MKLNNLHQWKIQLFNH